MTLQIQWTTEENLFEGVAGVSVVRSAVHILEFDAVTSENHEGRSEMTERAVESGSPISDHKWNLPQILTIEGEVTNTPLDAPPPSGYGLTTVSTSVSSEGAQTRVFSSEFDRVRDVWDTLDRLRTEATPVSISTRWRDYEDVQILSVTVPRDTGADAATFAIEVKQVRIAYARSIDTPAPREPRGAREVDRGAREGTDATARGSTLDEFRDRVNSGETVLDALGGMFGGGA